MIRSVDVRSVVGIQFINATPLRPLIRQLHEKKGSVLICPFLFLLAYGIFGTINVWRVPTMLLPSTYVQTIRAQNVGLNCGDVRAEQGSFSDFAR
jgi:hypothetical protein